MTWLVVWSSLLFALGLILGGRLGIWLEERSAARKREERREERRAARWLGSVRETRGGTVMPPEVAHDDVAKRMLAAGMYWDEEQQDWVPDPAVWYPSEPEVAHEAYLAHEELASEWHDHAPLKWDDEGVPGCPSCERRWEVPYAFPAWSLLNADPPTLGEEIQAMIANADAVPSVRWLDRLEGGQ